MLISEIIRVTGYAADRTVQRSPSTSTSAIIVLSLLGIASIGTMVYMYSEDGKSFRGASSQSSKKNSDVQQRLSEREVSKEGYDNALVLLQSFIDSDSTSYKLARIVQEFDKIYKITEGNFIPTSQNDEMDIVMDKPLMWGWCKERNPFMWLFKKGNPFLCLFVKVIRENMEGKPYVILLLSKKGDGLRPKDPRNENIKFLYFSDINENVRSIKNLLQHHPRQKVNKVYSDVNSKETKTYQVSLLMDHDFNSLPEKLKSFQLKQQSFTALNKISHLFTEFFKLFTVKRRIECADNGSKCSPIGLNT